MLKSTRFGKLNAAAGIGAGRLEQSNMIGTNNRSRSDNVNFQLKKRFSNSFLFQTNYTLAWSNSWGGRPTSSYSTNAIAISPDPTSGRVGRRSLALSRCFALYRLQASHAV